MTIAEDIDRAMARWALGEASPVATLESLLLPLEKADALAAIVTKDGDPVLAVRSRRARASLLAVAGRAGGLRLFATDREEGFAAQLSDAPAPDDAGGTPSSLPPPDATWLASEPFGDRPDASGAVVVLGLAARPDELLVVLPRIARAAAVVVARDRVDASAWKVTHALNNLLAGAVANAEYAASLIEGLGNGATLSADDRADIIHAIENTRDGVKKMAESMKTLTSSARKPNA